MICAWRLAASALGQQVVCHDQACMKFLRWPTTVDSFFEASLHLGQSMIAALRRCLRYVSEIVLSLRFEDVTTLPLEPIP